MTSDDPLTSGASDSMSRPENLVSESAIDEVAAEDDATAPASETKEVPQRLHDLIAYLNQHGMKPELQDYPLDDTFILQFELPAGRSKRTVSVHSSEASFLLGSDLSAWRSLERYDGIWNRSEGIIEVTIRRPLNGPHISWLLQRLSGARGQESSNPPPNLVLTDPNSDMTLRIGKADALASILLSASFRPTRREPITARIDNAWPSTTADADTLVERLFDAIGFDTSITFGYPLLPQRLENRKHGGAIYSRRVGDALVFPHNSYPHAAVVLYQAGQERITSPLIRYWSLYQVLEYFFPKYAQAEALATLSRHLRACS